jgi:hypothetical protein
MATATIASSEFILTLTEEERGRLLSLLELALQDKHVEARRTEAADYRKYIHQEEAFLRNLIDKLRRF